MGQYGAAAVKAAHHYRAGRAPSPPDAWTLAVRSLFPDSPSSQDKSCPKGAFLGLCEAGLVAGVPPGDYTRSKLNKQYAIEAVTQLATDARLAEDPDRLWQLVSPSNTTPNEQMDVVIALWRNGLIDTEQAASARGSSQ